MPEVLGTGFELGGLAYDETTGVLRVGIPTDTDTIPQAPGQTLITRIRAPDNGAKLARVAVRTVNGVSTSAAGAYTLNVERELSGGSTLQLLTGTSTVFVDSSGSAHTVTSNGDVTQNSVVAGVFSNVSGTFDGTGDFLSAADSDDWNYGDGDLCLEGWARPDDTAGTHIIWWNGNSNVETERSLLYLAAGDLYLFLKSSSVIINNEVADANLVVGEWFFWRVGRFGNAYFIWVGDQILASFYDDTTWPDFTGTFRVGQQDLSGGELPWDGTMDEFRVSKGIARGFPQIKPAWIDSSGNHTDITAHGGAYRTPVNPKFGLAYLRCVKKIHTGVRVPLHSDFQFGGNDFTVDFFLTLDDPTVFQYIWAIGDSELVDASLQNRIQVNTDPGGTGFLRLLVEHADATIILADTTTLLVAGTRYHVAAERDGSNWNIYIDGVLEDTVVSATTLNTYTTDFAIGHAPFAEADFHGALGGIDEFRVSSVARYGSAGFTPPTEAYTSDSNTKLLMHFDQLASFTDDTGNHTVYKVGTLYETPIGAKFDSHFRIVHEGMLFVPDDATFHLGTSSWTLDTLVTLDTALLAEQFVSQHLDIDNGWYLEQRGDGKFQFVVWTGGGPTIVLTDTTVRTDGQRYQVSVERDGNTWTLFVEGVAVATTSNSVSLGAFDSGLLIGQMEVLVAGRSRAVFLEEIRFSDTARYGGSGFTIPAVPYVDDGNTVLLIHGDEEDTLAVPTEPYTGDDWTKLLLHMDPDVPFDLEGLTDQTDTDVDLSGFNNTFEDGEYLKITVTSDNADLTGGAGIMVNPMWGETSTASLLARVQQEESLIGFWSARDVDNGFDSGSSAGDYMTDISVKGQPALRKGAGGAAAEWVVQSTTPPSTLPELAKYINTDQRDTSGGWAAVNGALSDVPKSGICIAQMATAYPTSGHTELQGWEGTFTTPDPAIDGYRISATGIPSFVVRNVAGSWAAINTSTNNWVFIAWRYDGTRFFNRVSEIGAAWENIGATASSPKTLLAEAGLRMGRINNSGSAQTIDNVRVAAHILFSEDVGDAALQDMFELIESA